MLGTHIWFCLPGVAQAAVSAPGGAGHALLFRDHALVKKDFKVREQQQMESSVLTVSLVQHERIEFGPSLAYALLQLSVMFAIKEILVCTSVIP